MQDKRERIVFYNRLPENLGDYIHSHDFLDTIETVLGVKVYYPKDPPLRVRECPPSGFDLLFPSVRGVYDAKNNIIWLPYGKWCRKTLIHEALHAMSYFAYGRHTEVGKVKLLNEGITEFLTGYILYKKFRKCYNVWLKSYIDDCDNCPDSKGTSVGCHYCSFSYQDEVKIVYILTECVGIKEIIRLYIYQPNMDWLEIYRKFLNKYNMRDELFINGEIKYNNFSERFKYAIIDAFELDEEEIEDILKSDIKDILNY